MDRLLVCKYWQRLPAVLRQHSVVVGGPGQHSVVRRARFAGRDASSPAISYAACQRTFRWRQASTAGPPTCQRPLPAARERGSAHAHAWSPAGHACIAGKVESSPIVSCAAYQRAFRVHQASTACLPTCQRLLCEQQPSRPMPGPPAGHVCGAHEPAGHGAEALAPRGCADAPGDLPGERGGGAAAHQFHVRCVLRAGGNYNVLQETSTSIFPHVCP